MVNNDWQKRSQHSSLGYLLYKIGRMVMGKAPVLRDQLFSWKSITQLHRF